jgi:hypothetical protein
MELILNVVWVLTAAAALACWWITDSRTKNKTGRELLSFVILLFILFPAISITDDLWAIHNPAETDILVRRSSGVSLHCDIVHHGPFVPLPNRFQPPTGAVIGFFVVSRRENNLHESPVHFTLSIRPPPVL